MLKPNIPHTTNVRAVLVKTFLECGNVDVVFPSCHSLLEILQWRCAEVWILAGIEHQNVKQTTSLVKVWPQALR